MATNVVKYIHTDPASFQNTLSCEKYTIKAAAAAAAALSTQEVARLSQSTGRKNYS